MRPLVEYCTPAWSPHYQKDKELIEKIQHRFTRMIPGLAKLPYSARLERLNLWTLEERRNRVDLIELYKISRAQSSIKLTDMFEPARDARTRGHSLKLSKNRCRLDMRKYFLSVGMCRYGFFLPVPVPVFPGEIPVIPVPVGTGIC